MTLSEEDGRELIKIMQELDRFFADQQLLLDLLRIFAADQTSLPDICRRLEDSQSMRKLRNLAAFIRAKNNPKISKIEIDLHNFKQTSATPIKITIGSILEKLEMTERCNTIRSSTGKRQIKKMDQSTISTHVTGNYSKADPT